VRPLVAHGGQLVGIAAAHGPAQAAACGVALQQVFDDQAAGEAGGAVDDQVKRLVALGWAAWVLKRQRARLSDAPFVDE
jgi:hypothetical protein